MNDINLKKYCLYVSICNFKTDVNKLDFGDFTIFKVRQGREAAEWKEKLGSKIIPRYILKKEFLNYRISDDDISGCDKVIFYMNGLLLAFRLFKVGDIMFSDNLIKDLDKKENNINPYSKYNYSDFKYLFTQNEILKFCNFKENIISSYINNKYYKLLIKALF